jgi:hypothetical protein
MHRTLTQLAALCAALALVAPLRAGEVPVGWKGKEASTAKLQAGIPAPALDAIASWAGFCEQNGYRMDLDAQGRVLLVTRAKRGRTEETLRLVGRAATWFDGLLPPVPQAAVAPASAPGKPAEPAKPAPPETPKPAPQPLPEDPEGPPPSTPPKPATGTGVPAPAAPAKAWGSGAVAPDSQTAVFFILHDAQDHGALLDHLERNVPYLKGWIAEARQQTGLTLEDPLVGAFVENAAGQEEWNGDHEVLNRVVQLLTLRRFGQQPNWLVQGLAWEAEMAFDGSVYCFPYRDGFVYATEHTSWPSDLRRAFKDRAARPLTIDELASWPRGTWDPEAAPVAWGFVHVLAQMQKKKGLERALPRLLAEYRRIRDVQDRRPTGEYTWERISGWSMDPEDQALALETIFGPDVFRDATAALQNLRDTAGPGAGTKKAKSGARK